MAFKAFHIDSSASLELSPREIFETTQNLFFVSGIQLTLIFIVGLTITTGEESGFEIRMPANLEVLAARLVCSIMMHFQVLSDVFQGLSMQKYVVNHPEEFSAPRLAFTVGFL